MSGPGIPNGSRHPALSDTLVHFTTGDLVAGAQDSVDGGGTDPVVLSLLDPESGGVMVDPLTGSEPRRVLAWLDPRRVPYIVVLFLSGREGSPLRPGPGMILLSGGGSPVSQADPAGSATA